MNPKPQTSTILVILPHQASDLICSIAFLKALKSTFPGSRIDAVVHSRFEPLMQLIPQIDLCYRYTKTLYPGWQGMKKMGQMIRAQRSYDLCFCLSDQPHTSHLVVQSGAKKRIGFKGPQRTLRFNELYPRQGSMHRVENFIRLLELHTRKRFEPNQRIAELTLTRLAVLPKNKSYVVVLPFGDDPKSRMADQQVHECLLRLEQENKKLIVLAGNQADHDRLARLALGIPSKRILNLAGKLSWDQLACLLKEADWCLGPASGATHLANALSVPSVFLMKPEDRVYFDPFDSNCAIVLEANELKPDQVNPFFRGDSYGAVFSSISIDSIIKAVKSVSRLAVKP